MSATARRFRFTDLKLQGQSRRVRHPPYFGGEPVRPKQLVRATTYPGGEDNWCDGRSLPDSPLPHHWMAMRRTACSPSSDEWVAANLAKHRAVSKPTITLGQYGLPQKHDKDAVMPASSRRRRGNRARYENEPTHWRPISPPLAMPPSSLRGQPSVISGGSPALGYAQTAVASSKLTARYAASVTLSLRSGRTTYTWPVSDLWLEGAGRSVGEGRPYGFVCSVLRNPLRGGQSVAKRTCAPAPLGMHVGIQFNAHRCHHHRAGDDASLGRREGANHGRRVGPSRAASRRAVLDPNRGARGGRR